MATSSSSSDFDLTFIIASHLDRHMVLPMLEFAQEKKLYALEDLMHAKLQLVAGTKMIDCAADQYKLLHKTDDIPADMANQRAQVYAQLNDWKVACGPLLKIVGDAELIKTLKSEGKFNLAYLKESYGVTDDMVKSLYRYAKLNFDCGSYRYAADLLFYFRQFSQDEEKRFMALWGVLAAEILMVNWTDALQCLQNLRDAIDQRNFVSQPEQLQMRTWLIHWSLFIFFHIPDGRLQMIEFLLENEKLLNAIQANCRHILRYLAASAIASRRRKNYLKELSRLLRQDDSYRDPIIDFFLSVYVEFDFAVAAGKLREVEKLLSADFFLNGMVEEVLEQARLLFFETVCRTHKSIDMNLLSQWLDFGAEAEYKIVDMIRVARIDAKIDTHKNQLVMGGQNVSIYQQVIDKTRGLSFRSNTLASQIEKRYAQANEMDD